MKIIKNTYQFSIPISDLVLFITFIYSILFYGGINKIRPIVFYFNSVESIAFNLIQLTLPPIFALMLYKKYQGKKLDIKLNHKSIYISFFLILFLIITQIKSMNLFADEIYYASESFKLNLKFLDIFIKQFPFFEKYTSNYVLQIITLIQWLSIIIIFYLFLKINYKHKLLSFVFIIFILRILVNFFMNTRGGPHPPLLYLSTNIFGAILGINSIAVKLSNCFPIFLFLIYLFNRLKMSSFEMLLLGLSLLTMPIIAHHSFSFNQTIYSFICFSVIFIEIYFFKTKPNHLFLFVAIMCLFRQTCIAAIPPLLIYSFLYNWPYNSIRQIFKINLENLFPLVLFFPVFINSLVLGTPTTASIQDSNNYINIYDKLLNEDLIFNSYNTLGLYLFFPLSLLLFLIIKNKFLEILIVISIFITYLALQIISDTPIFESKYYFELYGFIIAISIIVIMIYLFKFFKNKKIIKISFSLFLFLILDLYSHSYSLAKYKNDDQSNVWERTKNFNPIAQIDNNLGYCIDYLKTKNLINQTCIIGIDYGVFPLILNGCSLKEVYQSKRLKDLYYAKKDSKLNWLMLDSKAIIETKDIKYIILSDSILDMDMNKKEIEKLSSWEKIISLPNTKNYLSISLLRRK